MNANRLAGWLLLALSALDASPDAMAASDGTFDCLIEPAQVVEVRSPVTGILEKVHVRRGESIRQGQLLVSIESSVEQSAADTARFRSQAQGALLTAQAKVAATRAKARRMDELFSEEFVSAQARDDARAEAALAETELKTADENLQIAKLEHRQAVDQLNRRVLRSPFNGVVMDQYLYPGALVDTGEGKKPILKIAQTQPLAVHAIVPFQYLPQLKAGGAVVVTPEKPYTRDVAATISTIDRVVDSAAGTFGVIVNLPNADQSLPGGIRCKLKILGLT